MKIDSKQIIQLTRLGTRKAFGSIMCDLAESNKDIIVIAADVSSSAGLTEFKNKFPNQFLNVGIAEQNMVGIASGLAKEGANVFITSFASFASMRGYEAIVNLVGYMNLNVKIVGLGSGFSLGVQGNTHYALEDIAIMRAIPNMKIFAPADCAEEVKILDYLSDHSGPAYVRLTGIDGTPGVHKEDYEYKPGELEEIRSGEDIAIIASGCVVNECVRASRALAKDNISAAVFNAHTLKPFDTLKCREIAKRYKKIVSVEEHNVIGGLGSIIADEISCLSSHASLKKIGINDEFIVDVGDYAGLLKRSGLGATELKNTIMDFLNKEDLA